MSVPNQYLTYRSSTPLTVADVFREHWDEYRRKHRVSPQQAKVVGAMMSCRTPALGGRIDQCNECGALVFRYNSCRDRHCNQCQKYERAKWVEQQKRIQLPIPYFHIVFTTDHGLNPLFGANQRVLYDLLFQVGVEVLQQRAAAELGCELGLTLTLHTWGQQMERHVHLHCIVTGGGLRLDGQKWVKPKRVGYLVDVVKLSAAYRDRLLSGIKRLVQRQEIVLADAAAEAALSELLAELRAKKWEVFIKPFEQPDTVIEYLSRYVHQVAISNYRLESIEKGLVRFRYYDNRERAEVGEKGKEKVLTVTGEEFIRRFLLHLLPFEFKRIRYAGLHSSSARKEKLPRCRRLLGLAAALPVIPELKLLEWLSEVLGEEQVDLCPYCGAQGSLFKRAEFERLPWLVALILSLISQPTRQGVCR